MNLTVSYLPSVLWTVLMHMISERKKRDEQEHEMPFHFNQLTIGKADALFRDAYPGSIR